MKRSELETKIREFTKQARVRIESAPLQACFAAFVGGVVFVIFSSLLVPLVVLAAVGLGVVWLVCEKEGATVSARDGSSNRPSDFSAQSTTTIQPVNGHSDTSDVRRDN